MRCWSAALVGVSLCLEAGGAASAQTAVRLESRLGSPSAELSQPATFLVLGLPRGVLAALGDYRPTDDQWRRILRVHAASEARPAMLGRTVANDSALEFEPSFPLRRGLRYVAVFYPDEVKKLLGILVELGPELRLELDLEVTRGPPSTSLVTVFPSADELPENLLRFYLHFSAPMHQGDSYRHIQILDAAGRTVEDAFIELDHELWSPQGTRFTLLFDPGRLKSGLKPRREVGTALKTRDDFVLLVSAEWPDIRGRALVAEFRKSFSVAAPDHESPSPTLWQLTPPPAKTRRPLEIRLAEPLDEALLHHMLWILDEGGERVAGQVEIADGEQLWRYEPREPWEPGKYLLQVNPRLEDRSGNSIAKPFEVDLHRVEAPKTSDETIGLPFVVERP